MRRNYSHLDLLIVGFARIMSPGTSLLPAHPLIGFFALYRGAASSKSTGRHQLRGNALNNINNIIVCVFIYLLAEISTNLKYHKQTCSWVILSLYPPNSPILPFDTMYYPPKEYVTCNESKVPQLTNLTLHRG